MNLHVVRYCIHLLYGAEVEGVTIAICIPDIRTDSLHLYRLSAAIGFPYRVDYIFILVMYT